MGQMKETVSEGPAPPDTLLSSHVSRLYQSYGASSSAAPGPTETPGPMGSPCSAEGPPTSSCSAEVLGL